MKLKNILLVVEDVERSRKFYHDLFGLDVILDLDGNVILTEGLVLQDARVWEKLIGKPFTRGDSDAELYFEEDSFDAFIKKLNEMDSIHYVHPVLEHPWGQRVIRFYDPDHHIIEVGENMETVCRRFLDTGMTAEEIAKRMDVPLKYVARCIRASERHGIK